MLKEQKPAEVAEYLKRKKAFDCANPEDCSDACTGLNSQLAERRACDEQFLEDMTPPEYQDNNPNDSDNVINWGPDGNPNEQGLDGVLGCILDSGNGGGGHSNPECGVVTCADGLSTIWSASNCCQDLGNFSGEIPVSNACLQMQCVDSNPAVGSGGVCTCGGSDGAVVGNPEPPSPESGGLGGLISDRAR